MGASAEEMEDLIAVESTIVLSVNGNEVMRLHCTPAMVKEFVVGFLLTEGIVGGHFCLDSITVTEKEDMTIHVNVPTQGELSTEGMVRTSGCIGGMTREGKESRQAGEGFSIEADSLREVYREFNQSAPLFKKTGCMHSAAVCDGRRILVIAEDIGRHNAVDKVIGYCIIHNIDVEDKMMLVSGRISSEITAKGARWGIPLIVSRTSPTSHAIERADECRITLVGFLRGERFTIYTHAHRIL